jgi:hypothetical protein
MQIEKRPKSKKAKAETLSEKVNKANIKNMKEHIFTLTAFFEQQRSQFIHPENANFTFGGIVPPPGFPSHMDSFSYNSPDYKNMPFKPKQDFDNYGLMIKNAYLENVSNKLI